MEPDTVTTAAIDDSSTVMASIEGGEEETLILADVTRDDAFVTIPLDGAVTLPARR